MQPLSLLPLSNAHLDGQVGAKLDTVLQARILSDHARTEINGEALAAFRQRVDDQLEPGKGLWQGEFWGKWILSAVAAQQYTGNAALHETIRRSCQELIATQDTDGYIGTYADSAFTKSIDGKQFNWNIWCRKYTLWGLIESYELLRDEALLSAAVRFMDHLASQVGPGDGRTPIRDTGMFYGLPSTSILLPVVRLYAHTKLPRFLAYAHYIVDQWAAQPGHPPDLVGKSRQPEPIHQWFPHPEQWTKAYELISCVEGLVELYRLEKNPQWLAAAESIHRMLRDYERNIFGGIGKNDKLLASRFLVETESEICDAVYWQRLSTQLLCLTGNPVYAEEIERTLFNVHLGAMNAEGSWGLRRQCLSGEHWIAPQHCHLKHHHCCVANLPRGLLQAAQTAVLTRADGLALALLLPGTFHAATPAGQKVQIDLKSDYPHTGRVMIHIQLPRPETFTLAIRIPSWSTATKLTVGGQTQPAPMAGRFVELHREWLVENEIRLELDLRGRLVPYTSLAQATAGATAAQPASHVALERGPVVLARDIRLGDTDIDTPVAPVQPMGAAPSPVELVEIPAPAGIWQAYRWQPPTGPAVTLCDFASAGQTWKRASSAFRVWLPVSS